MFLELFDLFKLPFHLNLGHHTERSSHIGLIFSIAIYVFLLYNFSMSDLFLRNSPLVLNQSFQKQISEKIDLNKKLIALTVTDIRKNYYVDPSMFSFEIRYFLNESYYEVKKAHICTKEDVLFNQSLYELYKLNLSFCIDNENKFLEGFWEENKISYISISLIMCNNMTDNITCKDPNEIINFFKTTKIELAKYITFLMHESQIDLYDYKNPLKITYKTNSQLIDPDLLKKNFYYFKNIHVDTDDGYIFESKTVHSDITLNSKDFDFQLRYSDSLPFFQIVLYASKEEVKCTRIYQKLPDLLGSLLGIAQLFTFFCMIISSCVIYVNTLKLILSKLYFTPKLKKKREENKNFSDKSKQLDSKNTEKISTSKKEFKSKLNFFNRQEVKIQNKQKTHEFNIKNNFYLQKDKTSHPIMTNEIQKFSSLKVLSTFNNIRIQNKKEEVGQFELTLFEYCLFKLKKKIRLKLNVKETLIEEAEKIYKKQIDVITILKKIQELKKLKIFLFDKNNRIRFREFPKPIIPIKDKTIFNNTGKNLNDNLSFLKARFNLSRAFLNKNRKRSLP